MATREISNETTGQTYEIEIFEIDESEYLQGIEEYRGYCIFCRSEAWECEPDTRWRKCESCDLCGIFGTEELLVMGLIEFTESTES